MRSGALVLFADGEHDHFADCGRDSADADRGRAISVRPGAGVWPIRLGVGEHG